jgi:rSAM/selenodomain-associated transferase 2/rSAM/selenodomain-associated transferase 1
MHSAPERLIIFTRHPEPGTTKTRLIPVLGPEGAAALQRRLTARVAQTARRLMRTRNVAVDIRHAGGCAALLRQWLGEGFDYRPQGEGHLGRRMARCLSEAFDGGAARALLIGADIPAISTAHLIDAFEILQESDLVFGPAQDGGYYLIGARAAPFAKEPSYLGADIPWSSPQVLARTLEAVRNEGLSFSLLESLADIDRPEDLPRGMAALSAASPNAEFSVIVPTLNESAQILPTISPLCRRPGVEVIVVDAGSTDATPAIAEACGARVLAARPPRALQMNAGAALAGGTTLIFLHADTRLPEGFENQIRQTLERPGVVAGAFRLKIEGSQHGLRTIERVANWRSGVLQMPYGDQALFLRRDAFWESGAFPPIPILEDFEFIRRLKRSGRIVMAPGQVRTSPRRWLHVGVVKTWLINQAIIAAYFMGLPTERLAAWYRKKPRKI